MKMMKSWCSWHVSPRMHCQEFIHGNRRTSRCTLSTGPGKLGKARAALSRPAPYTASPITLLCTTWALDPTKVFVIYQMPWKTWHVCQKPWHISEVFQNLESKSSKHVWMNSNESRSYPTYIESGRGSGTTRNLHTQVRSAIGREKAFYTETDS